MTANLPEPRGRSTGIRVGQEFRLGSDRIELDVLTVDVGGVKVHHSGLLEGRDPVLPVKSELVRGASSLKSLCDVVQVGPVLA